MPIPFGNGKLAQERSALARKRKRLHFRLVNLASFQWISALSMNRSRAEAGDDQKAMLPDWSVQQEWSLEWIRLRLACVLRRKPASAMEQETVGSASWRDGGRSVMVRRLSIIAALALLGASTLSLAQQQELAVREITAGVFVHDGRTALMARQNDGAIANVGFIIGASAVAVIDSGGTVPQRRQRLGPIPAATPEPCRPSR